MLKREKNKESLHIQLEQILRDDIESGRCPEGAMLPREVELQELYGVSRITVRRALQSLTDKGYLKRIKHKGTFVKPAMVSEPLLKIKSFTKEMLEQGILPLTSYAHIKFAVPPREAADKLCLEPDTPVYHLMRVRCVKGQPLVLFHTYLRPDLGLPLKDSLYYGSLYDLLEKEYGIVIKKIAQRITAGLTDREMSELLHCEPLEPVLILKRQAFSGAGSPVEYTVGRFLAERYEYCFELEEK